MTLTHGLWAAAAYKSLGQPGWLKAAFWAMFPDLFWGIPAVLVWLVLRFPIPHDWSDTPVWLYHLHGTSHSLVITLLAIFVTIVILKKFPREMLAWPIFHILLDLPGHTRFQTPFWYPLSRQTFGGLFNETRKIRVTT